MSDVPPGLSSIGRATARTFHGQLAVDVRGFPVLLATVTPDDVIPEPLVPSARPSTVKHDEWARRQDAVREAAREFETLNDQDLRERLKGMTSKPLTDSELAQFRADVRAAELDDLVDALDQRTRGKLRGRRTVRLAMPRGYAQKVMRTLTAVEADQVEARLRARGWTDAQVKDDLRSKLGHLTTAA